MSEAPVLPATLADVVAGFEFVDRSLRAEMLVEYADRYRDPSVALVPRPYPEACRVEGCESGAYAFVRDNGDGTLDVRFAVTSPQGVTARAWAVILAETLAGQPREAIAAVPDAVVARVFGADLAPQKALGLGAMLDAVRRAARAPRPR